MRPRFDIHPSVKIIGSQTFFVVGRFGMRYQEVCYTTSLDKAVVITAALNNNEKFIQHTYKETYKGNTFHRTVEGEWMIEGTQIKVEGPTILAEAEEMKKLIDKIKEDKPKHPYEETYKGIGFHRKANGSWDLDQFNPDFGKYFYGEELERLVQSGLGLIPVDIQVEAQIMRNGIDRLLRRDIVSGKYKERVV